MKICPQCQIKYPEALTQCPKDGAALPEKEPAADPWIGATVDGRYLIEAKLGEGGMGMVYAARHVIIDKRVAIKVLKKEAQQEETSAQRFIQEAKSASKIGHLNIVDITDFGVLPDGSAYFVMEFLEGRTLGSEIDKAALPARRVVTIAAQVARGLLAAHTKGIVHRDLKPDNIFLVDKDGQADFVKIVDFGIAKIQPGSPFGNVAQARLTQVGMVLGTPEYMSPEQATGKDTDHRVDEYALGCIIYEMLVGEPPFRGDNAAGTMGKHVHEAAVPPSKKRPDLMIPPSLEAAVLKAMGKRPEDRYPGMRELLEALDGAGAEIESGRAAQQVAARVAERSRTTQPNNEISSPSGELEEIPRRRGGAAMVAGAVVLGLGGVAAWLILGSEEKPAVAVANPAPPKPVAPPAPSPKPAPAETATKRLRTVTIKLQTDPTDALVLKNGNEVIGKTPVVYEETFGDKAIEFTFRLKGHQDAKRDVVPDKNSDIQISLAKPDRQHHTAHARPSKGEAPAKPTAREEGDSPEERSKELRNPF